MAEFLRLTDDREAVLPYARQLLDALAFFPEDELSFKICRFAIEQEYRQYLKQGPETPKFSRATEILINAAELRAAQVHVTGLVALAIFGLKTKGERSSQEAAVNLISTLHNSANGFPFERWDHKTGKLVNSLKAVATDPSNVRQVFNKFRSVAHVCAARVTSTAYLTPRPPFEQAKEADASQLATVLAFQAFFVTEIDRAQKWNMRLIEYPSSIGTSPVILEPQRELMEAILGAQ